MASGKPNKNAKFKGKSAPIAHMAKASPAKSGKIAGKVAKAPAKAKQKTSIASMIKGAILGKKGAAGKKAATPEKGNGKAVTPAKAAKAAKAQKVAAPVKPEPVKAGKKGVPAAAAKAAAEVAAPVKGAPAKAAKGAKAGKPATEPKATKGRSAASGRAHVDENLCREVACEGLSTSGGYCRLHYIKNWKKIKRKELILKEKKLNQYIEELVAKYPDKYIEAIRQDLANDKDFAKVIYDLDLDESVDEFDVDSESVDGLIDNIKRDFDDEGDAF